MQAAKKQAGTNGTRQQHSTSPSSASSQKYKPTASNSMDPQQPAYGNGSYAGTGERRAAQLNFSGQEPGVGLVHHNKHNNSIACLPGFNPQEGVGLHGLSTAPGVGMRQALSLRTDMRYNNAQVTGDKRARDRFDSDILCGQRAAPLGQPPGPARVSAGGLPASSTERAPSYQSEASRSGESRSRGRQGPGSNSSRAWTPKTYPASEMDDTAAEEFGYHMNYATGRWVESYPHEQDEDNGNGASRQTNLANSQEQLDEAEDDEEGSGTPRMSLRYKLCLLRKVSQKMRKPGNWRWKTVKSAWANGGIKDLVDEVHREWLQLPVEERTKYGGDGKRTLTPKATTFMQFLSTEKKSYHKWKGGPMTTTSYTGQFWRDASPILDDIMKMDECKTFNSPSESKAFANKANVLLKEQRERARKAKQEAAGNVAEVLGGLQDSARELAKPMEESKEIRRQQMDILKANSLEMKNAIIQDRKDAADRAQVREDRDKVRAKEREANEKARAKEREANAKQRRVSFEQGEKLLNLLNKSFPALPKDATLPWPSYAEFWEDLPGVSEGQRAEVEKLCPNFRSFIKMGRDKKFGDMLLQSTKALVPFTAVMIASTIHELVYESLV